MNAATTIRTARFRQLATFITGATLLLITPTAPGGSIFDDDYIPPKRVEPAPHQPAPASPTETPTPAPPATTTVRPPDVVSPAPVAENVRRPVPDKASRTKCRKLFEDVFATELKDRSPASRRKLAERLIGEAGKTPAGSPDRFVLLMGAIQAAEEGQNLRICFAAARSLATEFGVDELATKADAAMKAFAGTPSAAVATAGNIERLLELSDQLMNEDDFATAAQVGSALQRAINNITDAELRTEVKNQFRDVTSMRQAREKLAPAMAQLNKFPDDPAANLAVGSFLCFQRGQWGNGLPLLAKSGDAPLRDLAIAELAGVTGGDALIKLADGWFGEASKLAASDRPKVMQHAGALYRSAEAGLTGLQKMAIEKRLAQIPPPARSRRVNLLDLFDPATHVVKGAWRVQDATLISEPVDLGRVEFPYQPPAEYDFKIGFTAGRSNCGVAQICYAAGHQFIYVLAGWDNTMTAFDSVNGIDTKDNSTARRRKRWLTSGQHYTSVIKVRTTGVEAYLDGQLVTSLKTDYSDLSLGGDWRLSSHDVVGIGEVKDEVRFDTVEIIEITGEGKVLSP